MENDNKVTNKLTKRGWGARPLLESQIKAAQAQSKSGREAADILLVSYNTYKKYAKIYGILDEGKPQPGTIIPRKKHIKNRSYHIDDLISGKHPKYPLHRFKNKLFDSGYVPRVCSCCGFSEARLTDGKYPLLLDFIDGNLNNRVLENIRPLCFNCFFLLVGNRNLKHFEAQNAEENKNL
jgi:hypothetical protein